MARFLTPLERAAARAGAQFGAIAHGQALAAGLSIQQIRTLLTKRVWIRRVPGVFIVAGSPDTAEQRAMVAWLATRQGDGVLSFLTAAWLHGLLAPPPLPHVTVRPAASARCRAARIHRSEVPPEDRCRRHGMVVTSVSRTIVDAAVLLERPRVEGLVDVAFCRKLATAESVDRCLARMARGHRGVEAARRATAAWAPGIEPDSVAEARLLRLLADLGLTGVVTQHEVRGPAGFVARLDVAVPQRRKGLEYDSVLHHGPRRWDRDESRYAALHALGWDVRPVTKLDLLPGAPRLGRIIAEWLASAAA